jgi:hypothetical protein
MNTLGFRLGITGCRVLVRLLSGPGEPVEYVVLDPTTLEPSPVRRAMMTERDEESVEKALSALSGPGTDRPVTPKRTGSPWGVPVFRGR